MFLTETEARLALYEYSNLISYGSVDEILENLHQNPEKSVELSPKCRLYCDESERFYIESNELHGWGKLMIFDGLELLEAYWEYLVEVCDFAEEYVRYLKVGYLKYKELAMNA